MPNLAEQPGLWNGNLYYRAVWNIVSYDITYNLDGGKTSQLYFNGAVISTPENGGRKLGDIVLVREPLPTDILVEDFPAETPAEESTETPSEAPSEESTETVTEQPAEIPETTAEIPEA